MKKMGFGHNIEDGEVRVWYRNKNIFLGFHPTLGKHFGGIISYYNNEIFSYFSFFTYQISIELKF